MSDQLPAPLVPAEVDLKDYDNVPLEFHRLFSSDTWILANHEEKCAAFCLWCESWHGSPAASLPDNDRVLAHQSQAGVRWPRLREHALRGWVKCSDGRLYHPVMAEKALEAWARHKKASSRGLAGASKRWGTGIASAIRNNGPSNALATVKDGTSIKKGCSSNASAIKKHSEEKKRSTSKALDLNHPTRPPKGQNRLKENEVDQRQGLDPTERHRRIGQAMAVGDIDLARRIRAGEA